MCIETRKENTVEFKCVRVGSTFIFEDKHFIKTCEARCISDDYPFNAINLFDSMHVWLLDEDMVKPIKLQAVEV